MAEFNVEQWAETVDRKLTEILEGQDLLRKRQGALVRRVVSGVGSVVTRRAAILIALGVLVGSALGSSAAEIVRAVVVRAIGGK